MGISVVFAAYNEEMNIHSTITRALDAMRSLNVDFEILIVDDHSTDSTATLARELSAANSEIQVFSNPKNIGQGASLVRGFQHARYDLVTHNAMDYPFDLCDLSKMLPLLSEADIVVATRRSRAGYSVYRVITSCVHRTLLHILFPLRLKDYNFVQLYPRSVWEAIKVEARSTAFLTPEALIRAYDMGYRVKEIAIDYHPRLAGSATSGKPKVILSSLRDMFVFWWKRLFRKTPQLRCMRIHEK